LLFRCLGTFDVHGPGISGLGVTAPVVPCLGVRSKSVPGLRFFNLVSLVLVTLALLSVVLVSQVNVSLVYVSMVLVSLVLVSLVLESLVRFNRLVSMVVSALVIVSSVLVLLSWRP
jgi:hypothetical protein